MVFISHRLCSQKALFPLLFYFKSVPLPRLIEPLWNVPGRDSHLSSQLANTNVFTFSWPFLEHRPFHLCFALNGNKSINVTASCLTTDLFKQSASSPMWQEHRLSQISLCSKDLGRRNCFYHCMLLNPKELPAFISSHWLVFFPAAFPGTGPLVLSNLCSLSLFLGPFFTASSRFAHFLSPFLSLLPSEIFSTFLFLYIYKFQFFLLYSFVT